MSDHFPDFSLIFFIFCLLIESEISEQVVRQIATEEPNKGLKTALAASCVLYNRTEHIKRFSIC